MPKKNTIEIEDKLLIGILSRKLKAGATTVDLMMLIYDLCKVLERSLKKEKKGMVKKTAK